MPQNLTVIKFVEKIEIDKYLIYIFIQIKQQKSSEIISN